MTLAERIRAAAIRSGAPLCLTCGSYHRGAAWSVTAGWHDAPDGPTVAQLFPAAPIVRSPFVLAAMAGQLPVKEYQS